MKNYLSIHDIPDLNMAIKEALYMKEFPYAFAEAGKRKTLGLLFFNSSLRTRLSTEKAARNLGMNVMTLNVNSDSWQLEFGDGVVMDANKAEHIKEAAQVLSQYCDILAVRAFPGLKNKSEDELEIVLTAFETYASVPIVNLESSTAHPLQGFTDAITIYELTEKCRIENRKPNVVLTWAPHPRALPHAVANSFVQTMQRLDVNFTITNPEGYDLSSEVRKETKVSYNQNDAFAKPALSGAEGADIVYVKNWSSYENYGQVKSQDRSWMITAEKLKQTNNAKVMHCLPVRRNVVIADDVLDSAASAVIQQAGNRTWAAQWVLKNILKDGE
ncbi:N-acetylornithine carbamoyltransferase [Dokdonia sinensis]|uniref:N-succinylornithine carbamoyltransferase n=1 Tax=Dokdonia sinensis TaxID=2479847 RepID=A0A3M0G7D1_9FLAO|nr:N-acetylornithine carbamoyltransferase [Dokdonia sinensis]RMB56949.1 N-acetylornithine carbamoyltransferase [Dokdonia sinensis]